MKLYTSHRAPNPRRVRWVMAEKGIDKKHAAAPKSEVEFDGALDEIVAIVAVVMREDTQRE